MNEQRQQSLTDRLEQTAQQKAVAPTDRKQPKTIAEWIEASKAEIAKALPKHITADRLARVALTTIRQNDKLKACNPLSLMSGIMQAAQLGLEPGVLGHCYLVPYGNEAQFIIGYKGMIDLMWRSGMYQTLYVQEICERDEYEIEYGSNPKLFHKPARSDRGKPIYYYLFAEYKNGGKFWHVMSIEEIEEHRARSRAANNGPWKTDYVAMCKKTVVRSASRWMPMSIELQRQIATDGSVKTELSENMVDVPSDVIDADYTDHGPESEGAA